MFSPGQDVIVDFDGAEWAAEVLKVEASGYVLCRVHFDPLWDFGDGSRHIAPEQTIAVRIGKVRAV